MPGRTATQLHVLDLILSDQQSHSAACSLIEEGTLQDLLEVLGVYDLSGLVEGGEEGLKTSCSVYKG